MPDFPNELVEAAAKAAMEAEPGQNWECATAKEADVYLRDSLAVLAVVVPLIEQRVIDKLAREAGEPPLADPADLAGEDVRDAWKRGAACGVAAERARCPLCDHEWRRHDPEDGRCDCHSETIIGPCQCGRDLAWMQERIAAMSCAALAPERTTGEGDARLRAAFDEVCDELDREGT